MACMAQSSCLGFYLLRSVRSSCYFSKTTNCGIVFFTSPLVSIVSHAVSDFSFNTAALYFLFNTLSMALFLVLQRPLLSSYPPAVIAFCSYFNATLMMAFVAMPIAYANGVVEAGDMLNLSDISWFAIVYSGIITSAFVFYATSWSSKRTSSIVVAGFFAVQVLSTTLLSAAVLATPIASVCERLFPMRSSCDI